MESYFTSIIQQLPDDRSCARLSKRFISDRGNLFANSISRSFQFHCILKRPCTASERDDPMSTPLGTIPGRQRELRTDLTLVKALRIQRLQ
jgi:hypothetical protein